MKTGLVVFAHGSRLEPANDAVRAVAAEMARRGGYDLVETAFLDLASPSLPEAVDRLIFRGAERVGVIPYFLTQGTHLTRDLTALADELRRRHPAVEIVVTDPLDDHPGLIQIVLDRARQAQERLSETGRTSTCR